MPQLPDLDAFAAMAEAEYASLPESFRALCADLEVRVAEWPDPEALAAVELEEPLDLLGLFEGAGLFSDGATPPTGVFPNRVWLFREPILAFTADGDDPLIAVVRHVLVHEIGHHFGLSDEDMYAIDDAPDY
ncbi:metallopeptidase family protein [Acuticoccus sp. MNP-M23]|uniref:metallopeptidase family protein n=1 Tax=Acuticoccus sp. MNP-M23 TaxID=3072793 RepID=UPI002814A2E4|nr:metallopeptidase family protein [Acuticoccus sp. MNP-M23]WMS42915.1 metallopeptidase family protein [Acuticoccus sp. MNP-M23]